MRTPKLRPLGFDAISHSEMKYGYTYKKSDGQDTLSSARKQVGLKLDRQQTRGQVRNQPGALVREMIESGLICDAFRGERRRHSLRG